MSSGEAELNALCNLLDEISDDEDSKGEEQVQSGQDHVDAQLAEALDQPFEDKGEAVEDEEAATHDYDIEEEEDAMEKQLRLMQEQMDEMQKKIAEKKQKGKGKDEQKADRNKAGKRVSEVDLFSNPSSSTSLGQSRGPTSPVKTNPFAEADKPRRTTKLHAKTPMFGPALAQRSTRVLEGEEKEAHMAKYKSEAPKKLTPVEKAASITQVRADLALEDSSDEEEARNPMEQKYNSYGKEMKQRIAREQQNQRNGLSATGTSSNNNPLAKALGFNQATGSTLNLTEKSANRALPKNLMVEPNSKLRVANPVLEKRILSVQMLGKKHIEMYRMKEAVMRKEHEGGDWVSIGVMYYKTSQTSKNGNVYTLWKMTDLQGGEIRSVTVFLFGAAHTRHYKIPLNKVVGILNAKVMDDRSGKGELSLSVDHPDKVLEIGDSLDAGKCKAQKQDGSGCTNLVNLASCEYCSFHVKKAYKAMSSKRGAIQSSFSGNEGVRERIMNKVDPKADYFCSNGVVNKYAGGGGMSGSGGSGGGSGGSGGGGRCGGGSVGRLSQDRRRKDVESLAKLNGTTVGKVLMAEETQNASAHSVMVDGRIRFRSHLSIAEKEVVKKVAHGVSAELGMKLLSNSVGARTLIKTLSEQEKKAADVKQQKGRVENGENESSSSSSSGKSATQLLFEHKKTLAEERARKVLMEKQLAAVPKLGRGFGKGDTIDLTSSSKTKALLALKGKSLDKKQPNYVAGRKRKADDVEKSKAKVAKKLKEKERRSDGNEKSPEKKISTTSKGEVMTKERMDAIRNTKSRHQNLIDSHEDEERDRRFDDLEKKEAMEEKMVNTKEMETRAVTCKACNYTDYKQSGLCRDKGHRIKLIKVKKRFFECKRCKNRTTALDRYPKMSCANCGESAWARVGMMRERKGPTLDSEKLVIRGAEQNFIGADIKSKDLILGL